MSEEIKLTAEELDDIAGGKSKKKEKPQQTHNKCLQCQIKGKMSENLWKVDKDITFCTEMYHIYVKGVYQRQDEKAVKEYLKR